MIRATKSIWLAQHMTGLVHSRCASARSSMQSQQPRAQRYTMEADAAQQQHQEKVERSHEVQRQLEDAMVAAAQAKQVTGFI